MADHMTTPFPRPWTAGPWEYRPDSATIHAGDFGGPLGDGHIATMAEYDANEPDARLIAAAPELFEALEAFLYAAAEVEVHTEQQAQELDAASAKARAALAKALGTEEASK